MEQRAGNKARPVAKIILIILIKAFHFLRIANFVMHAIIAAAPFSNCVFRTRFWDKFKGCQGVRLMAVNVEGPVRTARLDGTCDLWIKYIF